MPTTINGVGTHYYGKKNRVVRNAHCHSCERFGPLESYDTRLWFVVVFIPVIPLGRKRIIDSCPSCRRHMVAAADKYEQARQLQTSGSLDRFRREGTPEAALEAHAQLLAFHEYDQAQAVRTQALEQFPDDASLRVSLAHHLRQASLFDEMAILNDEAHYLDPELPEARAGVAISTMAQGLLDESRELLAFMEEPGAGRQYELTPLLNLAGKFAAAGRHAEALELFGVLLREAPHLGQRPDFRAQVRKSERASRGGESLLPSRSHSLRGLFVADGSPYTKKQRQGAIVVLALILGGVGLAISNEFIRRNRVIRVVNAGDPVQVQVDDGPIQTIPLGLGTLTVGEGKHRLKVTGPVQETIDVEIESSYIDRWAKSPVWVLNPGSEAVLEQSTVSYSTAPPPPRQTLLVGQPFVALPHVDYPFVDPPDSMQVKGKNAVVTKEVLRWIQLQDQAVFQELVKVNRGAALDFAEKRLRRNPTDNGLIEAYATQTFAADRSRADAFFQSELRRKPVIIPWHRLAQVFATVEERGRMMADYDTALATEPSNAALLYLRGRIESDLERRTDFYHRSVAADPRLAWPVMALGANALAQGRWDEAIEEAKKAESLQIDDKMSSLVIHTARLGLGQSEAMVEEYRARLGSAPFDLKTLIFLFDALAAAGHPEAIESERAGCENRLPAEARVAVGPSLRAIATYVAAQPEALDQFVKNSLTTVEGEIRTQFLLATGPASAVLATPSLTAKIDDPWSAVALLLSLVLEGKADEAKVWQDKAIALVESHPDEDQGVVAILQAEVPPSLDTVQRLTGIPAEKALLFALLAERFPDKRAEYRVAAARFNLRRLHPYLLIRRAIAAEAAPRP